MPQHFDAIIIGTGQAGLLGSLVVPAQWAQTQDQPQSQGRPADLQSDEDITIRAAVEEVNVIFTATDKKGRFKIDLTPSELAVLDDGKPPASLRSFRSETDLPLRVGLVLDVSGSITSRFTFEQDAAIRFFHQILRPQTDQAFVLAFDSAPTVTQDFTDDPDLLAGGVKKLTGVRAERPARRVIILISAGGRMFFPRKIEDVVRASIPSRTNSEANMRSPTRRPTSTPIGVIGG